MYSTVLNLNLKNEPLASERGGTDVAKRAKEYVYSKTIS